MHVCMYVRVYLLSSAGFHVCMYVCMSMYMNMCVFLYLLRRAMFCRVICMYVLHMYVCVFLYLLRRAMFGGVTFLRPLVAWCARMVLAIHLWKFINGDTLYVHVCLYLYVYVYEYMYYV